MRILLINPAPQVSLHTWTEVDDVTGCSAMTMNLALPTLAALAPDDVEIELLDEMVEPVRFDDSWDLVGITGYISQRTRMFEIADAFRDRGQLVAIGGPFASLSPTAVRLHADILFVGEAERTWPRFLDDFRRGEWQAEYRENEVVDLDTSPIPDIEPMPRGCYFMGIVQTSRGCPFRCEFCDVIVYLGRKQRHKRPERVVEELERFYQAGYRTVFLSDDNFTAYRKRAAGIMEAVRDWTRSKPDTVSFGTQLSIDVARDTELLDLCADAGLEHAFIGIETPQPEALRSVKKSQNLHRDLEADIREFHRRGIQVQAGLITGFDTDTHDCFETIYHFAQRSGVPIAVASILNAPEGTPLESRLSAEGRIREIHAQDLFLDTNIVPKLMSREDLIAGSKWLLNKLYVPSAFLERVELMASDLPDDSSRNRHGGIRDAALAWRRVLHSYAALGPEFADLPRRVARSFRGKAVVPFLTSLVYYRQIIGAMRRGGIWEPALAELDAPSFDTPQLRAVP